MKNRIEENVLKSQLWVALMMSCLCLFFGLLHQSVDYNRIFIAFFGTLTAYNFIAFQAFRNRKLLYKTPGILFLTGAGCLGYFLWRESSWELIKNFLFLSVFAFLYNSGFLVIQFRNISLLKIFIIAFVWTWFILRIGNEIPLSLEEFLIVFLFIVGITIPFDISDMERDSIQTIPKVLGIRKSKYLSCFCLAGSCFLFGWIFYEKMNFVISWSLAGLLTAILVLFMKNKNSHFYTRFWIEACSSLPLILYFMQK